MTQITLRNITLSHASLPLVENANLFIDAGERVTLIGRNGAGKSTLLRLIHGEIQPDQGVIEVAKSISIELLPQSVPRSIPGTVKEIVSRQLDTLSEEFWQDATRVSKILSKLQLDGDQLFDSLSGGMKRLALLASILVKEPDVLLLDEPTNHLDIEKIELLESLLSNFNNTIIFVTHDRSLLQKLANHIVEIDNGKLYSWRGSYSHYLTHKETLLASELKANALFDKKLAEEEQWIRQGIKARRTRNEGRVRMLKKMREARQQRRTRPGQVKLAQSEIELSGKVVFEVDHISFNYQDKCIIDDFSTLIQRGDKIGIIGPNGAGKSTLVNLLLGNLTPSKGTIHQGTKLTIGYFDQHRMQLNEEQSIFDALTEVGDTITIGGHKKHVMGYLQDFLFSPAQARTPVKNLSGGERNRVMLAKLLAKPCNLLVLDEPTNDLDVETLELLEELLLEYQGTVLLITHDRTFLNNVVTSTLVFEGNGIVEEYVGGYEDWLLQRSVSKQSETKTLSSKDVTQKSATKLTFKEKKELDELPKCIEQLEQRQHTINAILADPQSYKNNSISVASLTLELAEIEQKLIQSFNRWEVLEKKT